MFQRNLNYSTPSHRSSKSQDQVLFQCLHNTEPKIPGSCTNLLSSPGTSLSKKHLVFCLHDENVT